MTSNEPTNAGPIVERIITAFNAKDMNQYLASQQLQIEILAPDGVSLDGRDEVKQYIADRIHERCASAVGGEARVDYYEALRCIVQFAAVVAERRRAQRNGWEHGVPALVRHFTRI